MAGRTKRAVTGDTTRRCATCGGPFAEGTHWLRKYCGPLCGYSMSFAPAIYRYVCPDGRCYVGSTANHHARKLFGLSRSNKRIDAVIEQYPAETWTFELLEELPDEGWQQLYQAEQHYIEHFRSFDPAHGFNMVAASKWSPEVQAWLSKRAAR